MKLSPAEKYLSEKDPTLKKLITEHGPLTLDKKEREDYFSSLARSIISQQISVSAARAVFLRFKEATDLLPEKVLALTPEQIKTIGLSRQKESYLFDLAEHFLESSSIFSHLEKLSDEEVIAELTEVRGIGIWTAQMFLLFALERPDIFAPDDRGLQLAIEKHYPEVQQTRKNLLTFSERWSPYRSTASLHLWQSLKNIPATS